MGEQGSDSQPKAGDVIQDSELDPGLHNEVYNPLENIRQQFERCSEDYNTIAAALNEISDGDINPTTPEEVARQFDEWWTPQRQETLSGLVEAGLGSDLRLVVVPGVKLNYPDLAQLVDRLAGEYIDHRYPTEEDKAAYYKKYEGITGHRQKIRAALDERMTAPGRNNDPSDYSGSDTLTFAIISNDYVAPHAPSEMRFGPEVEKAMGYISGLQAVGFWLSDRWGAFTEDQIDSGQYPHAKNLQIWCETVNGTVALDRGQFAAGIPSLWGPAGEGIGKAIL